MGGDYGILYYTIIGYYLIVQSCLKKTNRHQILELDETVVLMKEPGTLLVKPDLNLTQDARSGFAD